MPGQMRSFMSEYQLSVFFAIANLEINWHNYLGWPSANEHGCNNGITSSHSICIRSHLPERSDESLLPP